ncbi:hypothetical protein LJC58_08050, partial [Lachnospiraceae bacterium OttesenSCG-928-D06]|nr:hypothetical protein [Lachnospiraceae bacterium OttesenSCG-928-D06]
LNKIIDEKNVKVQYANKLISSQEFTKDMNTSIFLSQKKKYEKQGIECISVRIPTETDLNIIKAKNEAFTLSDRLAWFQKENGWDTDSVEMREFNDARHEVVKHVKKSNGQIYYADYRSRYFNYINKSRVVLNLPKTFKNSIYLLGPCIVTSLFNQDKHTLGKYLQEFLNINKMVYRVVPLGIPNDADRYYFFKTLSDFDIVEGDKIFLFDQTFRGSEWDLDLIDVFQKFYKSQGTDFYYDFPVHCGKECMKEIAKFIFEYINSNPNIEKKPSADNGEKIKESKQEKCTFTGNPKLEQNPHP